MAIANYNPNARYDTGPNTAGSNGISSQAVLTAPTAKGLQPDGTINAANLRTGFNAAGMPRNNPGPNVAGAPRSVNAT